MSQSVLEQFSDLCKKVSDAYDPTVGEDELEPLYEEVLNYLKEHENYHEKLSQRIIEIMQSYRSSRESMLKLLPSSVISYCMHELRWPEIYKVAEIEHREFYSKNMATLMTDIMDAYDDNWEDKVFYHRFS